MALLHRIALASLSSLALAGVATSAHADQGASFGAPAPPQCMVSLGEQAAGSITLPSNAPALLVNDTSIGSGNITVTAELVASTGTRTPFGVATKDTNGLTILNLPATPAGTHTISLKTACTNGSPGMERETPLTLTAPVAFPATVGSISVVPQTTQTGTERIKLEPSAGLRAFMPATQIELSVDGKQVGRTIGGFNGGNEIVFTANTGSVCIENGALHREKRNVKIVLGAKIAGVAESPSDATLDLTVDCGAIKWTTDTDPGLDPKTPGGTSTTPGTSTTTTTGGCTTASVPGHAAAGAPTIAAIALASLVVLRRRRRAS